LRDFIDIFFPPPKHQRAPKAVLLVIIFGEIWGFRLPSGRLEISGQKYYLIYSSTIFLSLISGLPI